MKYNFLVSLLIFFLWGTVSAQPQSPPDRSRIRIADTLSKQERTSRVPIILRTELDSMIQLHMDSLPVVVPQQPVKEIVTEIPSWVMVTGAVALVVIASLLYLLFGYHRRLNKTVGDLKRLIQNFDFYAASPQPSTAPKNKSYEKKINELIQELSKEKELNQSIMKEYGLVKQSIAEVYKVRNYPAFDKSKSEDQIIMDLLKTEKSIAAQAFEKFLKPVIAITDANKNNPAKISQEESEKLLELLISLSLFHIEYLYLRINDLAVGGNMVQRIGNNGKALDPALLKKLNTEHGSRALVLRLALDKAGIHTLSYPVFDETDLNNH